MGQQSELGGCSGRSSQLREIDKLGIPDSVVGRYELALWKVLDQKEKPSRLQLN